MEKGPPASLCPMEGHKRGTDVLLIQFSDWRSDCPEEGRDRRWRIDRNDGSYSKSSVRLQQVSQFFFSLGHKNKKTVQMCLYFRYWLLFMFAFYTGTWEEWIGSMPSLGTTKKKQKVVPLPFLLLCGHCGNQCFHQQLAAMQSKRSISKVKNECQPTERIFE